jgi:hypothetical protein
MTDPLAELKRRAYGRPVSEADAAQAQAELLLRTTADAPWSPLAGPRAAASVPRRGMLVLAATALGLAVVASGIALAPRPSLDVFAMPQSGAPVWPGAAAHDDDIRWLGSLGPWDVFALRTAGGNVCITAFLGGTSGGGSCTSRESFVSSGLRFGTSLGGEDLSVTWGPTGGAILDGGPR